MGGVGVAWGLRCLRLLPVCLLPVRLPAFRLLPPSLPRYSRWMATWSHPCRAAWGAGGQVEQGDRRRVHTSAHAGATVTVDDGPASYLCIEDTLCVRIKID